MIRPLTKQDDSQCQQLLGKEPAENLFIIGDIEAFGYEQDFQKLWGEFNDAGQLTAVLLKYEQNYIPYAPGPFDVEGFAEIINNDPDFRALSGLKKITDQFDGRIDRNITSKRAFYYAKCTSTNQLPAVDANQVKQINLDDVERLGELLSTVAEFSNSMFNPESKKRSLKKGVSRGVYIEEDGQMVSTASTAAENSKSAMIVAVATRDGFKQKGYATKCLTTLCRDVLQEGKELCLFYDNPAAGAIYKRLGFQDIGTWTMTTCE
ncbi:GNAT family N-acetyltransferase [Aquibacillus salsiterrae]|uniref:GNAT family N-acetyltransferase n=1 Tax=Aquibacillus salsiterrae TaxID=2950439 RepID=A0A9X3WE55_9BACI|nr:GNAT family N-acetyltransferase [Aquibacillus salsiterrae]MDC3416796.1 GNAT family N-acetyltransferase [Aquibacillus salsiterrae]